MSVSMTANKKLSGSHLWEHPELWEVPAYHNGPGCLETFQVVCIRGFAPIEAHV